MTSVLLCFSFVSACRSVLGRLWVFCLQIAESRSSRLVFVFHMTLYASGVGSQENS